MSNRNRLLQGLFISLMIIIAIAACAPVAPGKPEVTEDPIATEIAHATQEGALVFQGDPDDLPPCGDIEIMRALQTPVPATPAPSPTPDPNAPAPLPAPDEDRIGFPENWPTEFKLMFVFDRPDKKFARAICGNDIAVRYRPGEAFEYGSVLLMVSYTAKLDANGQPMLDENGHYIRERLAVLHMMRKGEGFGEAYGENRSGEWEFVGYRGDGSYETPPQNSNFCAACHLNEAGHSVDYVFRMNMFNGGEGEVYPPSPSENEIKIYLYRFHEPEMRIKAGTTITWVNDDQAIHTIQAGELNDQGRIVPSSDPLFASGVIPSASIEPGASYSFTFDIPGTYWYLCTTHTNLTGKIIVSP
jgi:plastocyanin